MLDFLRSGPTGAADGAPVLVLLHGRGSHMGDLQGLDRFFRGLTLVTPQAPHPGASWGYGPGWAWYRYLGEDQPDGQSLQESLSSLEEFMDTLPSRVGFDPGTVVLGGFSQGGTTALAYGLTRPGAVDGVVNLSGFLARVEGWDLSLEPLRKTPLFWAHGTRDPAVPFHLATKGWSAIQSAGGRLETREYPMGHQIIPEEMAALRDWLDREVGGMGGKENGWADDGSVPVEPG